MEWPKNDDKKRCKRCHSILKFDEVCRVCGKINLREYYNQQKQSNNE